MAAEQEVALVPTQPYPTYGHRGPGAVDATAAAETAVPSDGSLEQTTGAATADPGCHNGAEQFYIGDDISEFSAGTPPRGAAAKVSESPDTKRQATEAAGQPKAVPSASSIDRKTQAVADQMQTGEETHVARPRCGDLLTGDGHEVQPAHQATESDGIGAEAALGGANAPLPLGN